MVDKSETFEMLVCNDEVCGTRLPPQRVKCFGLALALARDIYIGRTDFICCFMDVSRDLCASGWMLQII